MRKYKVTLECCDLVTEEVEANNKEEAIVIAKNQARGNVNGDSFDLYQIEIIN